MIRKSRFKTWDIITEVRIKTSGIRISAIALTGEDACIPADCRDERNQRRIEPCSRSGKPRGLRLSLPLSLLFLFTVCGDLFG